MSYTRQAGLCYFRQRTEEDKYRVGQQKKSWGPKEKIEDNQKIVKRVRERERNEMDVVHNDE